MSEAEPGKKEQLRRIRHSLSHLLAQAVLELRPGTRLGFGPPVDNGFYYDFFLVQPLAEGELPRIEERMRELVRESLVFQRQELGVEEALALLEQQGETFKAEYARELARDRQLKTLSFYRSGDFGDMCEGPHVANTSEIPADSFRLDALAGAYWRGNERNPQMTRIYGLAFASKEELESYVHWREEARQRDHRVLNKQLRLFSLHEEGPGFPFYLHYGVMLKKVLFDFWRRLHYLHDYQELETPMILSRQLWETSGHWSYYKENMYTVTIDEGESAIKPMNCPGAMLVYAEAPKSYRDLPLRLAELGHVHRHELSGVLDGLRRVRAFTQDDAHIFMTPQQVTAEVLGVIRLTDTVYRAFDLGYELHLATRPPSGTIGSDEGWQQATAGLKRALEEWGRPYQLDEGEAAFYGPKIDFHLRDALRRTHQCGTVQLDMALPERFDLTYIGPDDAPHRVVMIHRAIYGSIDRFLGLLIEHYAGAFPFWLAPIQAKVLPITEKENEYGLRVFRQLREEGFRGEIDLRNEKIGKKIHDASPLKIPYLLVVGKKEAANEAVAPRTREGQALPPLPLAAFLARLRQENAYPPS